MLFKIISKIKKILFFKSPISIKERIRISKIERYQKGETRFGDKSLQFVDSASFLSGLKEIFENQNYFFKTDKKDPVIIDCGANIGLSIIYFKKIYPDSKIIGFEPDPDIFKTLQNNIKKYNFSNVSLVQKAVWISNGITKFYKEGAFSGRIPKKDDHVNLINVEAIRLWEYLDNPVDFLKIDVEGAETEIIADCAEKLVNVLKVFIEYHSSASEQQTLNVILDILAKAGFRYQIKDSFSAKHPFVDVSCMAGMDFQADIYAYKQN